MRKYPFSPELLDSIPEELAELYRGLEDELLKMICERLSIADQLNEVTIQSIKALRSHGIDYDEIKKAIRKTTGISKKKLDQLFEDVVIRNQAYYSDLIDAAKVTQPDVIVSSFDIAAIQRQTWSAMYNITQSMGFLVVQGGRLTMLEPAKAYQWALDSATLQIQSGAVNYNQAIKSAVKQLADSGLRYVDYESGHRDHIDVAARRAIMTGVSQICSKYTEQSAEYLGTPYFEVSAHLGARDIGTGWENHENWQGKVYSIHAGDIYPSIYEVCGLGKVDGLEGANCRHRRYAFVDGVSQRTYTDEQLERMKGKNRKKTVFEGKEYTDYQATQKQREIERTIRKLERRRTAQNASGLSEDATETGARIRVLKNKYKDFSNAAGLREQRERMKVKYT